MTAELYCDTIITLLSNFKIEETMRTIRKNTKNVVKDKKGKRLHPVQQAIKLSIAALIFILLCVSIWLGRDYFKKEVNVPSLNLPVGLIRSWKK